MSSAISTPTKYEVKNIFKKFSSYKKIKIITNADKIIEHISSASYFKVYF